MRLFILLGHPNTETFCGYFADTYERAAIAAGHEVRRMNIQDMQFESNLRKGYKERMELEPDLLKVQENLTWSEHFVLVYPNWWGNMPAKLKGMWDRMFLPRFAFRMHPSRMWWDRLLKGRSARVIILCGNPPILDRFAFGNYTSSIGSSLLRFAGFKTRFTSFGPSETPTERTTAKWTRKVEKLARRGR